MTDTPDPWVPPEPVPHVSYVDPEPPPVQRAWPYALLLAIFNFVFGAILVNGSVRLGPILGLAPVAVEIILGFFLRRTNPRAARILFLAPLMMLAILAGLLVLALGICSTLGKF